jgi:hypothetical protein
VLVPSTETEAATGSYYKHLDKRAVSALWPLPIRIAARRPIDLPGYKRIVCPGERCGQRLAGNPARSIGWRETRQSPPVEWNDPLSGGSQFRLRLLLAAAQMWPSKARKNP